MLLKSGADTNMAMADGRTPLHISAESGTIAVIRQLLANGADPIRVDNVRNFS
jgi:ankyrin repeat protein